MLFTEGQVSVAQTLKHRTEENHMALEAMLLPHLHALHSTDDYSNLLAAFYGYFKPVETAILQHLNHEILPDMEQRRKADFILNDLSSLKSHIMHLPLATNLPQISNTYQALGALYVLEGSTLGGRGITKMLLKNNSLQLQASQLQFFNGYGSATGTMWTAFVKVLNNLILNKAENETLIAAANDTFLYFKNWLQIRLND
jgi:heme oxygenase